MLGRRQLVFLGGRQWENARRKDKQHLDNVRRSISQAQADGLARRQIGSRNYGAADTRHTYVRSPLGPCCIASLSGTIKHSRLELKSLIERFPSFINDDASWLGGTGLDATTMLMMLFAQNIYRGAVQSTLATSPWNAEGSR